MFRLNGMLIFTLPQCVLLGLSLFSAVYRAPEPEMLIFYLAGAMLGLHLGLEAVRWLYPYCRRLPLGFIGVWLVGLVAASLIRQTTIALSYQFWRNTGWEWVIILFMLACLILLMATADRQAADVVRLHQRYA